MTHARNIIEAEAKGAPHGGMNVVKDYNEFAKTDKGYARLYDLECPGCHTVWTRVAPTERKPTVFCDECAALQQACDLKAQELWNTALEQQRQSGQELRLPSFRAGHNTGVYALRDLLFAHLRGAGQPLSRWDQKQILTKLNYQVPPFGSRSV